MTQDIPFEPLSEIWGEYELEDGIIIRIRTIVTGVRTGTGPVKKVESGLATPRKIATRVEVAAGIPDALRGSPSPPDLKKETLKLYTAFQPRRPAISLYLVEKIILAVGTRPTAARRTNIVLPEGDPLIEVDSESVITAASADMFDAGPALVDPERTT